MILKKKISIYNKLNDNIVDLILDKIFDHYKIWKIKAINCDIKAYNYIIKNNYKLTSLYIPNINNIFIPSNVNKLTFYYKNNIKNNN